MKIIKVPFAGNCPEKSSGASGAPDIIVKELEEIYSSEDNKLVHPDLFQIEEISINPKNWEETKKNITEFVSQIGDFPIYLGGDHSVTFPLFSGFAKKFKNPGLVVFDAHPDTYHKEDYAYEHAGYLKFLINEGILKGENVIVIGVRNADPDEITFMKDKGVTFYTARQIFDLGAKEVCQNVLDKAGQFENMYISVDIDVLDPAFAPGTGCTEPGGISSRELIYFIQKLKTLANLKTLDIVEVNPARDINKMTAKMAAKLIGEFF